MTSNQILKSIFKKNEGEITKLRNTFLKADPDEKAKKKIGQYDIIKEIGKGGFAQVYEVEDSNHHKYALKEYALQNSIECFQNESIVGQYFFNKGKIRSELEDSQGISADIQAANTSYGLLRSSG
jgi:serine/threonine protein kinase